MDYLILHPSVVVAVHGGYCYASNIHMQLLAAATTVYENDIEKTIDFALSKVYNIVLYIWFI